MKGGERSEHLSQRVRKKRILPVQQCVQSPDPPLGVSDSVPYGTCSRQVFGLAGYLLAPASQFMAEPVLNQSFRSCLPLRGSSGFLPDSLFSLFARIRHREQNQYMPRNHSRKIALSPGRRQGRRSLTLLAQSASCRVTINHSTERLNQSCVLRCSQDGHAKMVGG